MCCEVRAVEPGHTGEHLLRGKPPPGDDHVMLLHRVGEHPRAVTHDFLGINLETASGYGKLHLRRVLSDPYLCKRLWQNWAAGGGVGRSPHCRLLLPRHPDE